MSEVIKGVWHVRESADRDGPIWQVIEMTKYGWESVLATTGKNHAHLMALVPELIVALSPFISRNSSNETIEITVKTADIDRARKVLAKAMEFNHE